MKKIKVFTDGASRGNPGKSGIGIVVTDEEGNRIAQHKFYTGEKTNNFAEYTALVESVRLLKKLDSEFDIISFHCDSELVVRQIKGEYKIKNKDLIKLSLEFWNEINSLGKKFSIKHIPRNENSEADRLANEAIDEHFGNISGKNLLIEE